MLPPLTALLFLTEFAHLHVLFLTFQLDKVKAIRVSQTVIFKLLSVTFTISLISVLF